MFRIRADRRQSGFSLLELVVVLVVLSLASGFAIMSLRSTKPSDTLRSAARDVAGSMKLARNCAISRSTTCIWSIENARYTVAPQTTGDQPLIPVASRQLPTGVSLARSNESSGPILFFARGDASGGTVVLRHERGGEVRIIVERLTASVKMEGLAQ